MALFADGTALEGLQTAVTILVSAASGFAAAWATVRSRRTQDADAAAVRAGRRVTAAVTASGAMIDRLARQVAALQERADASEARERKCLELAARQHEQIKNLRYDVAELRRLVAGRGLTPGSGMHRVPPDHGALS